MRVRDAVVKPLESPTLEPELGSSGLHPKGPVPGADQPASNGLARTKGGADPTVQAASTPARTISHALRRFSKTAVAGAVLGASLLLGSPAAAQEGAPVEQCVTTQVEAGHARAEAQRLCARGVELAQRLEAEGDAEGAARLRRALSSHGEGDDPTLAALVAALRGEPGAQDSLRTRITAADVKVEPTEDGKWRLSARLHTGNDNAATLLDGRFRSDDGATASLGAEVIATRASPEGHGEQLVASTSLEMLTERGGMRRTDLVDALVSYARRAPAGVVGLDEGTLTFTLGLESTGDFGGADLQDGWHRLGEGTPLQGRYLGQGLQDTYTGTRQTSVLLGARASGTKDLGLLDLSAGLEARAPIGPTGLGGAGGDLSARLGEDTGLFAEAGLAARYQWTNGDALRFEGAPVDGAGVFTPRAGLGWQGEGWSVGLAWSRNELGTSPGFGGLHDDRVTFGFTIGGGQRWR